MTWFNVRRVWLCGCINCPVRSAWRLSNTREPCVYIRGPEMAVLCSSYNVGHVLHHFTLQRSCLLQSGALPGRYGFLFLFLPPSAPLESSSAGSRSRLESDFASQSRSSASARGREHWWWVAALRQRTPWPGPPTQPPGAIPPELQPVTLSRLKLSSRCINKGNHIQSDFFIHFLLSLMFQLFNSD